MNQHLLWLIIIHLCSSLRVSPSNSIKIFGYGNKLRNLLSMAEVYNGKPTIYDKNKRSIGPNCLPIVDLYARKCDAGPWCCFGSILGDPSLETAIAHKYDKFDNDVINNWVSESLTNHCGISGLVAKAKANVLTLKRLHSKDIEFGYSVHDENIVSISFPNMTQRR